MRVPAFDADFARPAAGQTAGSRRKAVGPRTAAAPLPEWVTVSGGELRFAAEGSETPRLVGYWHVSPDSQATEVLRDGFEYNGHTAPSWDDAVHDLHLEFEAEVVSGQGAVVCKLTDGGDEATAQIAVGGEFGESKLLLPPGGLVKTANRSPLKPGTKHRIEMALVDRRVSVAVDGTEYFTHDLPEVGRRTDLTNPFKLGAQGATVVIRHVKLSRDIYYWPATGAPRTSRFQLGRTSISCSATTRRTRTTAGRGKSRPSERNFLGKPFLLHQPSRPGSWGMGARRVETPAIDWGRIRWLR